MKSTLFIILTLFSFAALGYSDQERVKDRLQLIETLLKSRVLENWSPEKLHRRKVSLNYLNEYWNEGRFPKNLIRPEGRHPVFQDQTETLCAVGYLMHRWGYDEAIKRIHTKYNEAYIEEIQDPEINEFVEKSGLDVEELKLIQPEYAPPDPIYSSVYQLDWPALEGYVKQGKSKQVLNFAVELGQIKVAKWILDSGVDPNFQKNPEFAKGKSYLLDMAAIRQQLEMVKLLIQHGARGTNGDPIGEMVRYLYMHEEKKKNEPKYYMELIDELLKSGAKLPQSLDLLKLVGCESLKNLKTLEKNGLDIAYHNYGRSSLHYCAKNGSLEVVTYLLEKGIPPAIYSFYEPKGQISYNTPIHVALDNGRVDLLSVLNKYAPLKKLEHHSGFAAHWWYGGGASLAGYVAIKKPELFSNLETFGVKPNDEDLVMAATKPKGLFEKFKSMNKQGFLKKRFRLIQIFTETCQLSRLKKTLEGLPISQQTEDENITYIGKKSFQSKTKLYVGGKDNCKEGVKLVTKKFPRIKIY